VFRLRTIVILGVMSVALWGLFGLLSKLEQPGQLPSPQLVACKKALIAAKLVTFETRLTITTTRSTAAEQLIGGTAVIAPSRPPTYFACVVRSHKITNAKLMTNAELADLAAQSGDWNF
jgi:hypothetical protein